MRQLIIFVDFDAFEVFRSELYPAAEQAAIDGLLAIDADLETGQPQKQETENQKQQPRLRPEAGGG